MKNYIVYISEMYSGYVSIEAESKDQAEELTREKLNNGEINPHIDFDADTMIEASEDEQ